MPLKRSYAKKEEVPQELAKFYVEQNGAHVLDVEGGFKNEDDVVNVKKALDNERKDHKTAAEELKALKAQFEGIDPEAVKAERDELAAYKSKGKVDEAAVEARIKAGYERKLKTASDQLADANTKISSFETERRTTAIKDALRAAAKKVGVRTEAEADVLMRAGMFDIDADGAVLTRDGCGVAPGLAPDAWLGDYVKTAPHWLPSSKGAGAKPGDMLSNNGDRAAKYIEAQKKGDIAGMIANAPPAQGGNDNATQK